MEMYPERYARVHPVPSIFKGFADYSIRNAEP